jgi:RNA polymerase sigma factor for flagellar operon FliA
MEPAVTADLDLWQAYRRSRDPGLRDQLIEKYLPVVKYVAARIAGRLPSHLLLDDLYSAGLLGFLDAIEDYDPTRGVEFAVYANPRIRGAIFDELRRLDCVPRRVRRKIREAERVIATLTQRLDRDPTDEEIALDLGMSLEDYHRLLAEGVTLLSLDAPSSRHATGPSPLDTLEDPTWPNPLRALEAGERSRLLGSLIDRLPNRERTALALYYCEELTMQEVGKVMGVTESRVSQLHSSAVLRLRVALRRHRLGPGELELTGGGRGGYGG